MLIMLTHRLTALLLLVTLAIPVLAADCVQTVRRNPDPNASIRGPDGQLTGVRIALTVEALRRMGCRAVVADLPWQRAVVMLTQGELDVLPAMHRTPQREAFALFSTRLTPARFRVFVRPGLESPPTDLEALHHAGLNGLTLGLQAGVTYGDALESLLADKAFAAHVARVVSRSGLWRMLALGRVDAVLAEDFSATWELQKLGLAGAAQATPLLIEGQSTSTAFSRRHHDAAFVARFDAALAEMARDGTEQAINERLAQKPLKP